MGKVRIYEIAKELNVSNKEMTDQLMKAGFTIKDYRSTLEDSQVEWVKKHFATANKENTETVTSTKEVSPKPTSTEKEKGTVAFVKKEVVGEKKEKGNHSNQPSTKVQATNEKKNSADRNSGDRNPGQNRNRNNNMVNGNQNNPNKPRSSTPGKIMPVGGWTEENKLAWEARKAAKNTSGGNGTENKENRSNRPNGERRRENGNQNTGNRMENRENRDRENRDNRGNRPIGNAAENNNRNGNPNRRPNNNPNGNRMERNDKDRMLDKGERDYHSNRSAAAPKESKAASYLTVEIPSDGKALSKNNRTSNSNRTSNNDANKERGRNSNNGGRGFDNNKRQNNNVQQQQMRDYSRPVKKPKHKKKKEETVAVRPEIVQIPENIQVREFAEMLCVPGVELVKKLFELGIMVTVNQMIPFDTAELLAADYDVEVQHEIRREEQILQNIVDEEESLEFRPPIVTVMGHVDHGKTSLLDRIRRSNVVSGEAGGITQHIGAYQAKVNDKLITFIDTPGHEAFTAMRARGANLTDIVILVVAADDGVMPQTIEAINHIKAAHVPFIVALNKIDKPETDPERVKQELTKYGVLAEEWGGDTIFVPVSAKTGFGLDDLMENLLLVAEINELKANPNRAAEGIVIEGRLDKGKGPVATILVQKGTLQVGDFLICGTNWCKVRTMTSDSGKRLQTAPPSTPVEITGWTDVPEAGEKVQAVEEKVAKEVSTLRLNEKKLEEQKKVSRVTLDDFFKQMQETGHQELNLIIKADVQGSIEALADSLVKLSNDEIKVSVIHSAVGAVNETDVMLASASNAIIIGFNVRPDVKARQFAEQEKIDIRLYRVIYEAIEDVKKAMSGLLEPEHREKYLGQAEVRQVIKVPGVGNIAGAYILDGKVQRSAQVRVVRGGVIVYEGTLSSLKRFKDDAKEVMEGYECGMGIKDYNDLKEGDIIEAYIIEDIPREI